MARWRKRLEETLSLVDDSRADCARVVALIESVFEDHPQTENSEAHRRRFGNLVRLGR